jgi:hypothetical protein
MRHTFIGVSDHGVDGRGCTESGGVLLKDKIEWCGDAACDRMVDTVPWSVSWITDHYAAEYLFAQLAARTVEPITRNLEASGVTDVRR